ncbi:MAG: 1-acyl-sn-glycerol-3-phosphate acyltransferase [Chloroflexi bacterium]|nr:1-acyl-sn-glycerol-3-phosphate acyltransferase [Chloroflexota bacterium]
MFKYKLIRFSMNILNYILLVRTTVIGREHIPEKGPYIVVLNHTSVADTPILLINFPLIKWRFFAVEKWRKHPIFGPIMSWLGAIYVKVGEVDRKTLREAQQALKEEKAFGLAPEGRRSYVGSLIEAKDGAAYLASRANVPLIPVGLVNLDRLFTNFKRLKITRLEVHIGEPFQLPDIGRRAKGADLTAYTHLIMAKIAHQLPEQYHGFYANSPALAALQRGEDPWPHCYDPVNP